MEMIEIPLWIVGNIVWGIGLSITGYLVIIFSQKKNQNFDYEWICPLFIFLVILFGGIFMGCDKLWECSNYVRFT